MKNIRKSEVIAVSKEAYMYLNRISRKERGCKPLTKEVEDRMWSRMLLRDGLKELDDNSIGGGDGTYSGRWWSWSVETLRKMLSEAGFSWMENGSVEYISL